MSPASTDPRPNRLRRELAKLDRFPAPLASWLRERIIGRTIPFVGTAGLRIHELSTARAVISLRDERRVMNHVGGPHAAATALLAETASGLAFGLHLPDDRLPLLRSMSISYERRSALPQTATAWLEPEQIELLQSEERGEVMVNTRCSDEIDDAEPPVICQMVWAWVPKRRDAQQTGEGSEA
jgi:acyl-coenzyme A thioesterase PaaI-like protein